MARTTAELVAGIIEVDPTISLTPFIVAAGVLVDRVEAADSDVSDTVLELIERWLAAHFYTVRDPRRTEERAGSVGERTQSAVDLFLSTSHYGQMAISLDPTGTLAVINSGKARVSLGVSWLGTEDE